MRERRETLPDGKGNVKGGGWLGHVKNEGGLEEDSEDETWRTRKGLRRQNKKDLGPKERGQGGLGEGRGGLRGEGTARSKKGPTH